MSYATNHHDRPTLVVEALEQNKPIYYLGIGSNMLRSKVEGRAMCGTPIRVLEMVPAVVQGYRLAFNMPAIVPLEPAMGSIEPIGGDSTRPLAPYSKPECHGALIKVSAEDYARIMDSEGIGPNTKTPPGYEEIIVDAVPYGATESLPVVALRTLPHRRLAVDAAPSPRYMSLLRLGAAELGLKQCYQDYLASHPVTVVPWWLHPFCKHHLVFALSMLAWMQDRHAKRALIKASPAVKKSKVSGLPFQWLNKFLFKISAPSTAPYWRQTLGNLVMAVLYAPTASIGLGIRLFRYMTGTEHPLFLKRVLGTFVDAKPATIRPE